MPSVRARRDVFLFKPKVRLGELSDVATTMNMTTPAPRDLSLPQWWPASRGAVSAPPEASGESLARKIGYLRLSVTRGCSMRCTYCRPDFDRGHDPAAFDANDVRFLVGHLHERFSLRKVRITGGEPTTRRDLPEIIAAVRDTGIADLAMTTNALTLRRDAARLRDAGLGRLNVSLDSLDAERFAVLTGVDGLSRVLDGIDVAMGLGFEAIKLNTVVVAGQNEQDLPGLIAFAAARGLPIRLIELMPMGPLAESWARRYVSAERMRAALSETVSRWVRDQASDGGVSVTDAARMWTAYFRDGSTARVGFISPMSQHFCDTCDRLRITADGDIYPCLMDVPRGSLRDAVVKRNRTAIDTAIDAAYAGKQVVHPAIAPGIMTHLGG
ncbi:MAG: radical SAM protein [Planctomycetota bacterium]